MWPIPRLGDEVRGQEPSSPAQGNAEAQDQAGEVRQQRHQGEPQVADIDRGDAETHPLGKPNGTGDLRIGVGDGRGGRDRRSDGGGELGHARLLVVLEVAAQWPTFLAFALPGDGCSLSSGPRGLDGGSSLIRRRARSRY
jgi:hypothetical protein